MLLNIEIKLLMALSINKTKKQEFDNKKNNKVITKVQLGDMFTRDLRVIEENIIDVSEYLFQKLAKTKNSL